MEHDSLPPYPSDEILPLSRDEYNDGYYIHDFPFGGPYSDMLSEKQVKVLQLLSTKGMCVIYKSTAYIFVPSLGQWCHSHSVNACRFLSEYLDLEKVSVNFYTAVEPYVDVIAKLSPTIDDIPRSVCVGTFRMTVEVTGTHINFKAIYYVTNDRENMDYFPVYAERVSSFTFMSLSSSRIPSRVSLNIISKAEIMLSNVLDETRMSIVKWTIGNALLDPVSSPRILYFYGPGGDGKTEAINALLANLPGCSNALTKDYVGNPDLKLAVTDVQLMMTSRVVTYGDCILKDGFKISSIFLKMLTSGDAITTSTISGRIECTGVFASNDLWYPSKQLLEPWFARRVILIDFPPLIAGLPPPPTQYNDLDVVQFASMCIKERLSLNHPPVTIHIALRTLFGYKAATYTRGVIYKEGASKLECLAAAWVIGSNCRLPPERLASLVKHINPALVQITRRATYILNLSTTHPKY